MVLGKIPLKTVKCWLALLTVGSLLSKAIKLYIFPLPWHPHRSICPVTLLSRSLVNSLVNVLMACGKRFKVTVQQPMAGSTRLLYFCVWLWSLVWFLLSLFVNVLMVILQPWIRVWSPRVRRFTSISFSFSLFFRDMVMFDSTSEKLI